MNPTVNFLCGCIDYSSDYPIDYSSDYSIVYSSDYSIEYSMDYFIPFFDCMIDFKMILPFDYERMDLQILEVVKSLLRLKRRN